MGPGRSYKLVATGLRAARIDFKHTLRIGMLEGRSGPARHGFHGPGQRRGKHTDGHGPPYN